MARAATALVVPTAANAQAGPSAYTTGTRYDVVGRVTGTIAPDPDGAGPLSYAAVRSSYDLAGRLIKVEAGELAAWQSEAVAPSAWSGFAVNRTVDTVYDALDRKVSESVGSGGTVSVVTQYSYDLVGRLECTAARMNPAVFGSLPASACTLGTEGSAGPDRITRNIYDGANQLVQMREGVGTPVEAAEATYSYTANGKRDYVIDANGNRAQLVYDGHDSQVQWVFPSTTRPANYNDASQSTALSSAGAVNAADYEQYGYDAVGNRTSLRKRDGSVLTFAYDALNRVTVKTVPERAGLAASATRDVHYDYDLRNLMTKARFDSLSGDGMTSVYDGFGQLTSSMISMSGLTRSLTYAYDREGRRLLLTHPDGQTFTYARDGLGRAGNIYEGISQIAAAQLIQNSFNNRGLLDWMQRATSPNAFKATYGYDPIGRLASTANDAAGTANDLTISQGYSPASQIISQTRSNDAYSWAGSVNLTRAYSTNGLNQYTAAGPASFTYDANGNLTSDGLTNFTYDIENRLVTASGAKTAALVYDPMGRLFETSGGTAGITRFLYDGDELAAEYDSAGALARRYVHSDNVDDPVAQYDGAAVGAAARTFLMPDERGSIAALFYNGGTLRAANTYDEYGIPGAANQGRFQYTGQAWIPELGMYYYKARIYSPTLGRFLQTDPIGYDDQVNLYAYVGNDPMNHTDPDGQELVAAGVGALFGAGLETADQLLSGKGSFSQRVANLDGGRIVIAGAAGGLAGLTGVGVASLAQKAVGVTRAARAAIAVTGNAAAGGATSAGQEAANQIKSSGRITDSRAIKSSARTGAVSGVVGAVVGSKVSKALSESRYFGKPGVLSGAGKVAAEGAANAAGAGAQQGAGGVRNGCNDPKVCK